MPIHVGIKTVAKFAYEEENVHQFVYTEERMPIGVRKRMYAKK
jgi:hypothetical protein